MGDYWGAVSIGYNKTLISNPPKTFKDLLKPEYKGKVAINGTPAHVELGRSPVVFASALANGGSLRTSGPGSTSWRS